MNETDKAWLAGLLSGLGTIYVAKNSVHLVVKSTNRIDMLERACSIMGSNLNECKINRKEGWKTTISGEKLKRVIKQLWPYLTNDRRREYVEALQKAAN